MMMTLFVPSNFSRMDSIRSSLLRLSGTFSARATTFRRLPRVPMLGVAWIYTLAAGFSRTNFSAPLVLPIPASPWMMTMPFSIWQ